MKKLLAIVASALTLGAFADAGDTPIIVTGLDTANIETGEELALVRDGETVATTTYEGESSMAFGTDSAGTYQVTANGTPISEEVVHTRSSAPKFTVAIPKTVGEGEVDNMPYYLALNGDATNAGSKGETGITVEGELTWSNNNKFGGDGNKSLTANGSSKAVIIADEKGLASFENGWTISMWIQPNELGNWRDVMGFSIGGVNYRLEKTGGNAMRIYNSQDADSVRDHDILSYSSKTDWIHIAFVSNSDSGFDVYANGAKSYSYTAASASAPLWGTAEGAVEGLTKIVLGQKGITDRTDKLDGNIDDFALFTKSLDANQIALLSAKAPSADILIDPKDVYLVVGANTKHIDLGNGESFVDAEAAVTTYNSVDTIHVNNSVQLFVYSAYAYAKFVVGDDEHADVNLGFARTNSGNATMDHFDVTVNNGGIVEINNVTRGGSWNASMNPEVKGSKIHGSGKVTIPSGQNVTISDASVIELPIVMSGTATLVVKTGSTVASVTTADTDKVIKSEDVDGGVKYTVITEQVTLKIPVIEHTIAQYSFDNVSWINSSKIEGDYNLIVVDKKQNFYFRYISEDETKWTVSGYQGGYKYTTNGLSKDTTYDAPKTGITVTAVAPVVPGIDLIPEDQKTGYPAWLEANITTETTLEVEDIAAAFLLGATVSEGVTIEDAAQAKVKELVAQIDLAALAAEGEDAALTTLNAELEEKGLVASLDPVELEGADSDTTKLYKLVIKLIEQN